MKGFEIKINAEKQYVSTEMGIVLVVVNDMHNDMWITTTAVDKAIGLSMDWGRRKLCIGDKLKITATNVEVNSPPINVKPLEQQEMLSEYYTLKEMLTKEGLIK